MNIPSLQVKDTIIFRKDSQYCFQVCRYNVLPDEDSRSKNAPPNRSMLERRSIFAYSNKGIVNESDSSADTDN